MFIPFCLIFLTLVVPHLLHVNVHGYCSRGKELQLLVLVLMLRSLQGIRSSLANVTCNCWHTMHHCTMHMVQTQTIVSKKSSSL